MALNRYETAGTIIMDLAPEVGLQETTNPFTSSDPGHKLLCRLLTVAGRELLGKRNWPDLIREGEITVVSGESAYSFPDDYAWLVNQTAWHQNRRVVGPVSEQEWQEVAQSVAPSVLGLRMKLSGQAITFQPQPAAGTVVSLVYMSRGWVWTDGDEEQPSDRVAGPADLVLYEPQLIGRLLKLRFLQAKGFATEAAMGEYLQALDSYAGRGQPAKTINLTPGGSGQGYPNIPETGFGAA